MVQEYYISLIDEAGNELNDIVSTKKSITVKDYIKIIHKNYKLNWKKIVSTQLVLYKTDGITEISPETLIKDLEPCHDEPMFVKILDKPPPLNRKDLYDRGFDAKNSCQIFFNFMANRLFICYNFSFGKNKEYSFPTFEDVIYAYDTNTWQYWYTYKSEEERILEPTIDEPFLHFLSEKEWEIVKRLNSGMNERIEHDNIQHYSGYPFIIIPHSEYNDDTIAVIQKFAIELEIIEEKEGIIIKDEDELLEPLRYCEPVTREAKLKNDYLLYYIPNLDGLKIQDSEDKENLKFFLP